MEGRIMDLLPIQLNAVVLECKNPAELADFYIKLLGWMEYSREDEEWVDIISPSGEVKIAFQRNDDYRPPVWPDQRDEQQQMMHLDFVVQTPQQLQKAVAHGLSCGAALAQTQYGGESWITLIDPAGHPFCFVLW